MERHRREQEMKRKRNALSLEEINDQLTKLQVKVKALREEKHQFFQQLKKVCSEDDERKKQNSARGAELLAQQQQQLQQQQQQHHHQQQQQQQQQALALQSQNQLLTHQMPGYPYLPGALVTRPADPYHRPMPGIPVTSSVLSVPHSSSHIQVANGSVAGQGKPPPSLKRRHGSPLPVPSSRPPQSHHPQTSSFSAINNPSVSIPYKGPVASQSAPSEYKVRTSSSLLMSCISAETTVAGYPFYFGAQVPTTMAFDAKGNQCYVAVPVSESAHREMLEHHYQQIRHMNPMTSNSGPIQMSSMKPGGISTGFPVQRSGSVSSPSLTPRDMKNDPHSRPYPRYY